MQILVIPDIHLKPWIFDRAEDILESNKADRAVCLMDIPDNWDLQFQIELYKQTFDRATIMLPAANIKSSSGYSDEELAGMISEYSELKDDIISYVMEKAKS